MTLLKQAGLLQVAGGGGSGTVTSVAGAGTVNGLTLTGTVTTTGNLTLGGTLDLSSPPAIGGTAAAAATFTDLTAKDITLSGNINAAAWTTSGLRLKGVAATFTDTTSSGTVASAYTDVLGGNTIAASAAVTFTNYYTAYFKQPVQGTNVTFTNKWSLGLEGGLEVGGTLKLDADYTETLYAPAASGSQTVSLANGTVQKFATNANFTATLPASVAGKSYVIIIAYGGAHSLTFAGGGTIKWTGGTAPTGTAVNGKFDIFSFFCDGTNTYGAIFGQNF